MFVTVSLTQPVPHASVREPSISYCFDCFFFSRPLSCPIDLDHCFLFISRSYCCVRNSRPSRDGVLLSPTGNLSEKALGPPCVSPVESGTEPTCPKAEPSLLPVFPCAADRAWTRPMRLAGHPWGHVSTALPRKGRRAVSASTAQWCASPEISFVRD